MLTTNIISHLHQSTVTKKERWDGRRVGKGQAQVTGLCYWSKQSFLNQIVPSIKWSNRFRLLKISNKEKSYNYIRYSAKNYCIFLCTRCTSGHSSRVMGPRSSALCSTVPSTKRRWGQTLWKTAAFLFCSIYTRYFKTTIQRQLVKKSRIVRRIVCVPSQIYLIHRGFWPLETMKGTESSGVKTILCSPQPNQVDWQGKKSKLPLNICHKDDISMF